MFLWCLEAIWPYETVGQKDKRPFQKFPLSSCAIRFRNVYKLTWLRMAYANLCWALLLAVIVRSVKTLAFSGKYLKIVESGYTQLPVDVLQLKTPTLAGCHFVMKSPEVH